MNGKPIFLYDNLLKKYAVTITSEAAGFPKENLFDDQLHTLWKPTSTATQYISIDAGAPVSVDSFNIGPVHTLKTGGSAVYLQYSTNGTTWFDAFGGFYPAADNQYEYRLFAPISARYWQIVITQVSVIVTVGQLAFGSRYTLPRYFNGGFDNKRTKVTGKVNTSGGGQRESLTFHKGRVFPCAIRHLYLNTQAETDYLAWLDAVREGMPFWCLWDVTGTYEVCFVSLKERELGAPIKGNIRTPDPFTLLEEL